ncbi:hypothetical protein GCM10022200_22820 [Microbacterium awajiense]|uniref:Uncharacterized protein n=1 Tax=Microbacterium awajiense TaxID=415214 RepID=A0ABP7ASG3_9MICO
MTATTLSTIARWLTDHGQSARLTETGLDLGGDDTVLEVRSSGEGWTVRKFWRDQDRGVTFAAAAAADVDRYLAVISAGEVRTRLGLERLRNDVQLDDGTSVAQPGYTLTGDLSDGFVLTDSASGRSWTFASDVDAARYSRYAHLAPDDVRALITAPAGRLPT